MNINKFPHLRFFKLFPKNPKFKTIIIKIQKLKNFQDNIRGKGFAPIWRFWVYDERNKKKILAKGKTRSIRLAKEIGKSTILKRNKMS